MPRLPLLLTLTLLSELAFGAPPPLVCPAGSPIGIVNLRVRSARGVSTLPLKTINRLEEGDSILYAPVLHPRETRTGEVAVVLVHARRDANGANVDVLEPKPAGKPEEWRVLSRTSVAAFVYGPSGLNRKRVERFLSDNDELVSQLADYAEKTAQTEALIQVLSDQNSSSVAVDAAFRGFASHYGLTALDRTAPTDQQMTAMFRTLNPAMASYDPIASTSGQGIGQTAGLIASVAGLFFGSPIGIAAGGTAMLMEMRSLAFPNTIFRSSFAQVLPDGALGLCGKRDGLSPHSRVAFVWASRIPNIGPPHLAAKEPLTLASGSTMSIVATPDSENDWKYIDRARNWKLVSSADSASVNVIKSGDQELALDLSKTKIKPGRYRLQADWDWDRFEVPGEFTVAPLSDFAKTRLQANSQDRLIAKEGRLAVSLEGDDFEFVNKVSIEMPADKFFTPAAVPFALPAGFRKGVQNRLDVQVNTVDLDPGEYRLMLSQPDGKAHAVPIAVLPAPPQIDNLPFLVNCGESRREMVLHGKRLEQIAKLEASGVHIEMGAPIKGGTERPVVLRFDNALKVGDQIAIQAFIENRTAPLSIPEAIRVMSALPQITSVKLSLPAKTDVTLQPGELPGSFYLSALLRIANLSDKDSIGLRCRGDVDQRVTLVPGTHAAEGKLAPIGTDQLFLTFNDSAFPNRCDLVASVVTLGGRSDDYSFGKIVRVPKIESARLDPAADGSSQFELVLTGRDLETIEQTGWDPLSGVTVPDLPTPAEGEPDEQELRIQVAAAPNPSNLLYVWLRDEESARATSVRVSAPPLPSKSKIGLAAQAKTN